MTFTNQQRLTAPEPVPFKSILLMVLTSEQCVAAVTNWRSSGEATEVRS